MNKVRTSLIKSFVETLEKDSNRIILGHKVDGKWCDTTREHLYSMVQYGVRVLKDRGVEKGDRVAYKGCNSVEWVAWNMSCYAAGAIWVPMYHNQSHQYCDFIVKDCTPKLLISDDETFCFENQISTQSIGVEASPEYNGLDDDQTELAALVYTSGTTGNPKGVMLSHNNILSNINGIHNRFHDADTTTSLNILPWAHIYGLTCELYYNMIYDNCTKISSGKEVYINECREVKPDVVYIVPKILDAVKERLEFLDAPLIKMLLPLAISQVFGGNLHTVYTGGAKLDDNTKRFYIENGLTICEGYGCTETAPMISVNHQFEPRNDKSVGKILDGVRVTLINGEIHVAGDNVMSGYWKNNAATNKALIQHQGKTWYKTGDSGEVVDDFLFYNGRISENYKLNNGKFVDVMHVESIMKKHIKGNAIVFGEDQEYNSIISDSCVEQITLDAINTDLEPFLRIKSTTIISPDEMQTFLTPKMSIKRHKLIDYVRRKLTK
tara:strand:- start:986 stop:2467 length:1482 start_codon:yes stop_codon:yes gene_type:complete